MSTVKHIQVDTFPPISNINKELKRTQHVLHEMFNRFPSENNTNTLEHAEIALDGYCYVPEHLKVWAGRYVRYINMSKAFDMKLMVGGFVVNDNGYTVTLKTHFGVHRVSKRGCLWFMAMIEEDIHRINMKNIL